MKTVKTSHKSANRGRAAFEASLRFLNSWFAMYLCFVLLSGLCVLALLSACKDPRLPADKNARHPFPLVADSSRFFIGKIICGDITVPVSIDSSEYQRGAIITAVEIQMIEEQAAFQSNMGAPAYWEITDKKGKAWRFSAVDMLRLNVIPKQGKVYKIYYGKRKPYDAVCGVWNVLYIQEVVIARRPTPSTGMAMDAKAGKR